MQIDFKKLIKKYETNLVDKLRGFGEEEFLNFWVPASDDLNSIINLIDALYESKFYKIQIINLDLSNSDINELKKFMNIAINTISKDSIDVNIIPKKYIDFKEKNRKISSNFNKSKNYSFAIVLRVWQSSSDLSLSGDMSAYPYGGDFGRANLSNFLL